MTASATRTVRYQPDPVRVCALVPYPQGTTPSQRFRIEQWMPYLDELGISVDLLPFADEELMRLLHRPGLRAKKAVAFAARLARRLRDIVASSRYDAILIHRAICIAGPAALERAAALAGKPVIYDFDDAIFLLHTTEANRRFGWMKFPGKTATICRLSAHVVVGNGYLADYARRHNPRVSVIPSSIDTSRYQRVAKGRANGRVVVGWMGSSTSQTHLEMFAHVLRELVTRCDVEVRVISDRRPDMSGLPVTWRPWSADTEVEEVGGFDIGIMPMPDDEWSLGKCSLKALQYMAMGVPAVCSAVGANRELIRHGHNGLLASTTEEWVEGLTALALDPALRRAIGAEGQRTVEQRYSASRCAELFARVVHQSVGHRAEEASLSGPSIAAPQAEE